MRRYWFVLPLVLLIPFLLPGGLRAQTPQPPAVSPTPTPTPPSQVGSEELVAILTGSAAIVTSLLTGIAAIIKSINTQKKVEGRLEGGNLRNTLMDAIKEKEGFREQVLLALLDSDILDTVRRKGHLMTLEECQAERQEFKELPMKIVDLEHWHRQLEEKVDRRLDEREQREQRVTETANLLRELVQQSQASGRP